MNVPFLNAGGPTVTTHTNFLNKRQTQQTITYNLTQTKTASRVCIGVVKVPGVQKTNLAQHAADLGMLQPMHHLKPVFSQDSGNVKEMERKVDLCIRKREH